MAFTVGQLAKLTGLTVRALHHYDAIGLLVPSHRSDAGYRLYTQADTARLFQIQALRRLGLSLAEIHEVLAKNGASLPEIVAQQIEELNDRIEQTTTLRAQLLQLGDLLADGAEPGAGDWAAAVELITQYDQYYSSEEMNRLIAHGRTRRIDEWPALITDVRAAMARGVAIDSEEAQHLSDRWRELIMRNVGGDTSLAIKMKLAYFEQPELRQRIEARSGLDAAVTEYVTAIWTHRHTALWARRLGADDASRVRLDDDRMREWLRIVAEMRDAMKTHAPESAVTQHVLREWDGLLDEFSAGDPELRKGIVAALNEDPELQSGWALDAELLSFVARARACALPHGAPIG